MMPIRIDLSFAQQRLWFIDQLEPNNPIYNVPLALRLRGKLNVEALKAALNAIVARHEVLRTSFHVHEGKSFQEIASSLLLEIDVIDLSHIQKEKREEQAKSLITQSLMKPFNLQEIPLLRAKLLNLEEEETIFLLVLHHSISDEWSLKVMVNELSEFYAAEIEKRSHNLTSLPVQYADFSLWQREYLDEKGEIYQQQMSYWRERLKEAPPILELSTDYPRPVVQSYKGDRRSFSLSSSLKKKLDDLSKKNQTTLFMTLLASFYTLLYRYTGQEDIIVGSPIANRNQSEIENLIGFFVNTLALRAALTSQQSFKDLLLQVKERTLEAYDHQDLPFEALVNHFQIERNLSHAPLFQVMFVLQNAQKDSELKLKNLTVEEVLFEYPIAKFDLTLTLMETKEGLQGSFEYATDLFKESTINQMIQHYEHLLEEIVADPSNNLGELELLSLEEKQQILIDWNNASKEYPDNKTIHQLFEEQVEKTPHNIAVVYENKKLTYRELNERANQLASYLRQIHEIKPDTLIALCLERSEHMLIAILAVLKAGGAYVPIDTGYPDERIQYILEDTSAKITLTNKVYKKRLENISQVQTIILEIDNKELQTQLALQPIINPKTTTTSANLAYVIYTSGTTGKPKGVMQLHCNVMRLFTATDEWYQFNQNDVWTLFHSYVFDFTIWELWGALIYGGKLVIPTYNQTRDLNIFYELCKKEGVTVLNQTPIAFYQFIEIAINKDANNNKLNNLRYVIFGGDALSFSKLKQWISYYGYNQPRLINMYGITETTVHVTYKPIMEQDLGEVSYIGKVIPDLKAYVLDYNLKPVPVGVLGELHVGGKGLARGYLNKPDLTIEKFIANPFQAKEEKEKNENSRLYKTGDLVRWLADGNLEYIGRNDFQVKIRGYRIELGEIESILNSYEGVRQSVILAREHLDAQGKPTGNKYLVGYYISDNKLDEHSILNYVKMQLPEYMIPTALVFLEKFPLTINGKLDTKALPEPNFTESDNYVAPRNELESKLCKIWSDIFGFSQDKIGIYDNFFSLGGDSILSIKVVSLAHDYGIHLKVRDIFTHQTISGLASLLQASDKTDVVKSGYSIATDKAPLTSTHHWSFDHNLNNIIDKHLTLPNIEDVYPAAQMQIFMLEQYKNRFPEGVYHVQQSWHLQDTKLDINNFVDSLNILFQKHPAIRTTFLLSEVQQPLQVIRKNHHIVTEVENISHLDTAEQNKFIDTINKQDRQNGFDASSNEALVRSKVFIRSKDSIEFMLSTHHAIIDGWSNAEFIKDLFEIYSAKNNNKHFILSNIGDYKNFVINELSIMQSKETIDFWKEKIDKQPPLPQLMPRNIITKNNEKNVIISLNNDKVKNLQLISKKLQVSLKAVFLSKCIESLNDLLSVNNSSIGIISNGRIEEIPNILTTYGLYWNIVPFYQPVIIDKPLQIQKIQQQLNEIVPFINYPYRKMLDDNKKLDLFYATFNFINFHNMKNIDKNDISIINTKFFDKFSFPVNYTVSVDYKNDVKIRIEYDQNYFTHLQINNNAEYYRGLLEN